MKRTERDIKDEAKRLESLTFEQQFNAWTPEDINANSLLAEKMLTLPNPDASWVEFAHMLGRLELTMGEAHRELQGRVTNSLQLLMVLTGASNEMQILEYTQRLKQVEKRLPSLVKQLATGIIGGQIGSQGQSLSLGYQVPSLPPSQSGNQEVPSQGFAVFPWNTPAKGNASLAPKVGAGAFLIVDGVQISNLGDNAFGIVVEVDAVAKTARVAVNGEKIDSLPASLFTGLSVGDELLPVASLTNGRYLVTAAEALNSGVPTGSPSKIIARVLKNNAEERLIVVLDRPISPLPPA